MVNEKLYSDPSAALVNAPLRASAAVSAQRNKSRPATDRNAALQQQIPQQIAQVRKHATACGDQNSATQFCEGVDDGVSFDERPIGAISRTRQHNDECTAGKADADTKAKDHADDDHQPTTRIPQSRNDAPYGERGAPAPQGDIPCETSAASTAPKEAPPEESGAKGRVT
jgi:hypothetical protein